MSDEAGGTNVPKAGASIIDEAPAPPPLKPKQPSFPGATILVGGALYGLLMRILFGLWPFAPGVPAAGVMMLSFLFAVPFVIGVWSVSRLPPARRRIGAAIVVPWLPMFVFVAGTALLDLEGAICIVLAIPIFMLMASLGGLLALAALKTGAPRSTANAMLVLPLVLALAERAVPISDVVQRSTASVHVAAPPERIFALINNATAIEPGEIAGGWAWRIGVPLPIEGVTVEEDGQRVRKSVWQKGVHFDEPIVAWDANRHVRWRYRFDADSFPPGALDEHVRIGGEYFDLVDTAYTLVPEGDGTRLTIDIGYRISTRFNAYAARIGRFLIDDAADTLLAFYRRRAEADGHDA